MVAPTSADQRRPTTNERRPTISPMEKYIKQMISKLKITVLADNKEGCGCCGEHGLSLYIEADDTKVLLDAGRSQLFAQNAKKLGIDLTKVDVAVLSHSHYDHADGFDKFFEINNRARLYARKETAEIYYSMHEGKMAYIGPRKGMLAEYANRIEYVDDVYTISGTGITLIPHSTPNLSKVGNHAKLYKKINGEILPDDFSHEQTMAFETKKGLVIFNSCSHSGPEVIINEVLKIFPDHKIYAYIGGFHLFRLSREEVCEFAKKIETLCIDHIYTGHCTGEDAYSILSETLGKKACQIHVGKIIELNF